MLWKRLTTETPHRGNASKKKRKPLKSRFFWVLSAISVIKTEIPQNPVLRGLTNIFEGFPNIFEAFPQNVWGVSVYLKLYLVEVFPLFFEAFPQKFWGVSVFLKTLFSWGVSAFFLRRFRKIFEAFPYFLKLYLDEAFPQNFEKF